MSELIAINGTICECNCGTTTDILTILPNRKIKIDNQPVATINDHKVGINLRTFGACKLKAMNTCVPVLPSPWSPGCPNSITKENKILHQPSTLQCAIGGIIKIVSIPQKTCFC